MTERKLKLLCRICLSSSCHCSNIYVGQSSVEIPIYEIINFVYELDISVDDGLPEYVCRDCLGIVKQFENYKRNAQRAKKELILLKEKKNVSVEKDVDFMEWEIPLENIMKVPEPGQHFGEADDYYEVDSPEESNASSELKNFPSLEASEETARNSFDGVSSIRISQVKSIEISDTNKGIHEEDLRDDIAPVEESAWLSPSVLNDTEPSPLKAPLSKSRFVCDICKKGFTRKWNLGYHMRVHNDERPFKCNICDKTFKQDNVRYGHELKHLREKMSLGKSEMGSKKNKYICENNLSSESLLSAHSNLRGDKYKCISCGNCFGNNADLIRHFRTHTKEKPFKCEVCFKCFSRKSDLNRHSLIHSSEKPYSCEICNKRFRRKQDKTQHALHHLRKK